METQMSVDGRSSKTRTTFRLQHGVAINIAATPEKVWSLLTRASEIPGWNSTVKSVTGEIAEGQRIEVVAHSAPDRVFKLKVGQVVPNRSMVWSDGMPPMFKGVRTYTLVPKTDGTTDFHMIEVFTGLMLPMIAGSLPDFGPIFEQYAADLKRAAERS
jgi:uncharacterized protein YndB with AHSA1/START domain